MYNKFTTQNFATNSDLHNHNTRNRNDIVTPHLHKTRSQSCWIYRSIHLRNTMPVNLRECETVTSSSVLLKTLLWNINRYLFEFDIYFVLFLSFIIVAAVISK